MTLAAELNPRETELNPHEAVPGGSPHQGRSEAGFPRTDPRPPARQLAKAEPSRRTRPAVPITLN
jgi:hypothetical protein